MSLTRKKTTASSNGGTSNAAALAQNAATAAQNAAGTAQVAAQNAAQTAAANLSHGWRQGVHTARSWAAPRLDSAADYCTTTVAPKVSAALHTTARQVEPKRSRSSRVTWSLIGAAVAAAVGAAAAMAYRFWVASDESHEVTVIDKEESVEGTEGASGPDGTRKATAQDGDSETSVNGRVSASGW